MTQVRLERPAPDCDHDDDGELVECAFVARKSIKSLVQPLPVPRAPQHGRPNRGLVVSKSQAAGRHATTLTVVGVPTLPTLGARAGLARAGW